MKNYKDVLCPSCKSEKIILNGRPNKGNQQYICKNCNKYFAYSTANTFDDTHYPFAFIAHVLYFRKNAELTMKRKIRMKEFSHIVNSKADMAGIKQEGKKISRQTIYRWIKKYDMNLKEHISPDKAKSYFDFLKNQNLDINNNEVNRYDDKLYVVFKKGTRKHLETLKQILWVFGSKEKAIECSKQYPDFFNEIFNIVKIYELPQVTHYTN